MADLTTEYLGLSLRNPLVVASCGLTGSLDGVRRCAQAGAGAVVLKSLFEEQIAAELGELEGSAELSAYGEGEEYLQRYGMALGPREYLELVAAARREVAIPVIPSLNCVRAGRWGEYAAQLERAGAAALELNIALMPTRPGQAGPEVEETYFRILHEVKSRVRIPVAVKLGPWFTAFARFAERLSRDRAQAPEFMVGWCGSSPEERRIVWRGADALVLFNRFYQFDIDLERLQPVAGNPYSTSAELHTSLRWVALLAGRLDCQLAAATGIHTGADVLKQLLAGATVVQLCSTLYRNGLEQLGRLAGELAAWMETRGFSRLDDFRGRLSQARSDQPDDFERLQYIRLFGGIA